MVKWVEMDPVLGRRSTQSSPPWYAGAPAYLAGWVIAFAWVDGLRRGQGENGPANFGAPGRNRTCDTRFRRRKPLLFRLGPYPAGSFPEHAVATTVCPTVA